MALLLLLLLGLGLRMYRLSEQSAWCDEAQFFWLYVPDLRTFCDLVKFWGPDNVLLYYVVFYGWSRLFGISLLAARGMTVDFEWFYGHYNLALGRARTMPDIRPHPSLSEVPFCLSPDYLAAAVELGLISPGESLDTETLTALRRIIYHWPPLYDYCGAVSAFDFLGEGHADLADRMARYVLESSPNLTMARFALGLALLAQDRDGEAQRIFRELWPRHRGLQYLHENLIDALLKRDCGAVAEQYERLRAHGHIYWIEAIDYLLRRRCGI